MGQPEYRIGDIVFWATASAAGEYTVIGFPKGEPNVLVFEEGGEVDAELCQPTGRRAPVRADKYRRRYLEEFPGKLEGSEQDRQTDYFDHRPSERSCP